MTRFADGAPLITNEGTEDQQERRWYYKNFRQSFGRSGSAYGLMRLEDGRWRVDCILDPQDPGSAKRLGVWDSWEDALRVQDYCVQRDVVCKLALIQLYEHANYEPMEKFLTDAVAFGQLPRRRLRVTLEIDIEHRGTDEEAKAYALVHLRTVGGIKAARVVSIEGPRLEEPKR